jgi:hypothetical protein
MATKRTVVRSSHGVVLTKLELMNNGVAVDTGYLLETLRNPEKRTFGSLAEADAAYLQELGLSKVSEIVAQRLGR